MMALGRYFAMDFCVDYDPVIAFKWYGIAEMLGDLDAASRRQTVAEDMTAEQIAEADGMVDVWSSNNSSLLAKQ
jgi:TPR repeat protein